MVAQDGDNEGLFRGAFMHSGSPISIDVVDGERGHRCEFFA